MTETTPSIAQSGNIDEWIPVAEAAPSVPIKERTLWNWTKRHLVPTKTVSGVICVRLGDVRNRLAARVAAATQAPSADVASSAMPDGTVSGGGGSSIGGVAASRLDGDLTSRIFALLDEGLSPVEIVRQEHLPALVVLQAVKERRALIALSSPEGPSREQLAERLAQTENALRQLGTTIQGNSDWQEGCVNVAQERIAELEAELLSLHSRLQSAEQYICLLFRLG